MLRIDAKELRPLIEQIVGETLAATQAALPADRLAYPEPEAAALLGVRPYVLRDARRRGELTGARVGSKIVYAREELAAYLCRQRIS